MVFLVTYPDDTGGWRGYFTFRASNAPPEQEELRTADLFLEATEPEIDLRARGLGRPLLLALLESALGTHARRTQRSADTRRWCQQQRSRHSAQIGRASCR